MNIGEKIREIRDSKNISQEKLSELSKIPRTSIGRYERGNRIPNIQVIKKIADALDVSLAELTGIQAETYRIDEVGELKKTDDIKSKNNSIIFTYNQKNGTDIGLSWTKENYKLDPSRYFIDTMSKYINEVDNDALKLIISNIENVEILKNTSEYINGQIDLLEGNLFD